MSERMTAVRLPGGGSLADRGRRTPTEMIQQIREYAKHEKAKAEAILAADDKDFHVVTYVGVYVHRNPEILQESALKTAQGNRNEHSKTRR